MRNDPLSVVMPAYQAESTVDAAVRSTLRAMQPQDRLIVRDDGSTDRTAAVISSCKDPRVRLIRGENVGVARGLQLLLEEVDTPLVARMDADDLSLPWRFSVTTRLLGSGRCDAVFGSTVGMTESQAVSPKGPPFGLGRASLPLHLLLANPLVHPTLVARTQVLRSQGGYRLSVAEDYDLWLRLAAESVAMMRTPVPVLRFRYSETQITARPEWLDRLKTDELLKASYDALSRKILGTSGSWLPSLIERWHGGQGDPAALADFTRAIRGASHRLSPSARVFLDLRLARLGLR